MPARHLITVVLIAAAVAAPAYAKKDKGPYRLQVGPTGLIVQFDDSKVMTVAEVEPGSYAAKSGLKVGDVLLKARGAAIAGDDIRVVVGEALTAAEATDGKLTFTVRRGGATSDATVVVPVLGAYSPTYPVNCPKSKKIVAATAAYAIKRLEGGMNPAGIDGGLTALFLMATGEKAHLDVVARAVRRYVASSPKIGIHSWNNGFTGIALAEYYLKTGEKCVLPVLKTLCDNAAKTMTFGAWAHWNYPAPGYVRGGVVNAAGCPLLSAMILSRECGVAVSEPAVKESLKFFARYPGYGPVPYGDHRPGGGMSSNGKSGQAAVALSLIDEPLYQAAARTFALDQADSIFSFEGGHTGNFTNVLWRILSIPHIDKPRYSHFRKATDGLRWYYDLCRRADGSFRMQPTKGGETRYTAEGYGMVIAMNYVAGLKTLRITGAKPTQFSKIKPFGPVIAKDMRFLNPEPAEGYTEADFEPAGEIFAKLKWSARKPYCKRGSTMQNVRKINEDDTLPPLAYIAKCMRHRSSVVRNAASNAIGYYGDAAIPEIIKALHSTDPRVVRAGLDGLVGYQSFFFEFSPFLYTPAGIAKAMPHVVRILNDPKADLWLFDGALLALSTADPATIAANFPAVRRGLKYPDWWVRSSAVAAATNAGAEVGPIFDDLIDCYVRELHAAPKTEYSKRIAVMLRSDKIPLTAAQRDNAIKELGHFIAGDKYREPAYVIRSPRWFEHRSMAALLAFPPDQLTVAAGDINRMLAKFGDPNTTVENPMLTGWILGGDKWDNPGLLNVLEKMSPSAQVKFVPGLKALLAGGLDKMIAQSGKKAKAAGPQFDEYKKRIQAIIDKHR